MLRLELINNNVNSATYNYYPEDKESYGTISINKKDGEIEIIKLADDDESRIYLRHAVSTIEKYLRNNEFMETDFVAWY